MQKALTIAAVIVLVAVSACGKDDKSAADRDAEVKKVLQQGADAERKMYEGMKEGVENIEKKVQEKKEK
jgi:hypothetical protein